MDDSSDDLIEKLPASAVKMARVSQTINITRPQDLASALLRQEGDTDLARARLHQRGDARLGERGQHGRGQRDAPLARQGFGENASDHGPRFYPPSRFCASA